MARLLENWLTSYQDYTRETESAPLFHKWVGLSMVGSALRKKTWLSLGRIKVFPNLYVVLVAEPGIARKSQSISYGVDILNEVPSVITSADAITKEALLQDLESSAVDEQMPDGTMFRHSSLSIISREFESFLGQKSENTKMLVLLTDLYDCQEIPWKYRTKNSGTNTIPSVYLNILGATTPESLASCLPSSAIGGGLTSRIIFVWSSAKTKKIPFPEITPELRELRTALIHDLTIISRIVGNYKFKPDAMEFWKNWYLQYDETSNHRICKDPAFNGWYSRKPMFVNKLSQILAACSHSELLIGQENILQALALLEEAEKAMGQTFCAIGKSNVASEVDLVMSIIRQYQRISEKQLMQMIWRDVDSQKFDVVIQTILKTGKCQRSFKDPQGKPGIFYSWVN